MKKIFALLIAVLVVAAANGFAEKPNVILIMTDDQGYGDLSCHGNSILKTPQLDRLHAESIRMTDFHVSPFCTPTRAALMTGRFPARTGAYRTSSGRTMMHPDEKTVAHVFAAAGYVTGMVGKWHLGDNAPHRPQDRGFQDVVWHRCGGVGQASDYWGNDYFDDTYERNGRFEKFEGYCTDIWFAEAKRFIKQNRKKPFFLYLATNAPHGPYLVGKEWQEPYQRGDGECSAPAFHGMIANIDHNLGLLRDYLDALGLAENTILLFLTDNGTSSGAKLGGDGRNSEAVAGFNAGMRGRKSSIYDGGHRVPLFVHWPAGGMTTGRDVNALSAHVDILPTLAELCGIPVPEGHAPDGRSFAALLRSAEAAPHRDHLLLQFHGGAGFDKPPRAWKHSAVMTQRWRLLDGEKLYDIQADPAQRNDIAAANQNVVAQLRAYYEPWWASVSPRMTPVRIDLGSPAQNPTVLCSQDWYMPRGNPPWNFPGIRKLPRVTGPWNVNVTRAGRYRLTLRQLPAEANMPVKAVRARVAIAGQEAEAAVTPNTRGVVFELDLPAGPSQLRTWLYDADGKAGGAYFVDVEALEG